MVAMLLREMEDSTIFLKHFYTLSHRFYFYRRMILLPTISVSFQTTFPALYVARAGAKDSATLFSELGMHHG